jgi:hypothetical protein
MTKEIVDAMQTEVDKRVCFGYILGLIAADIGQNPQG